MKKMKPIPLRILSVLGVVILLFCSVAMPVFASGSTSDPENTDVYYSYWNLTKIEVVYADTGETVIFDMPSTFFQTTGYYNENITLTSGSTDRTLSLRSYVGETLLEDPSVSFAFDVKPFSSVSFIFENSVIKPYPTIFVNSSAPGYSADLAVPVIQFQNDVDVVSRFEGNGTSIRPMHGAVDDDFTFKFGRNEFDFGQNYSDYIGLSLPVYDLVPNSLLESELRYYAESITPNTRLHIPYYDYIRTEIDLDFSEVTSSTYNIAIALPLGVGHGGYSFNHVSEWYSTFFTGYKMPVMTNGITDSVNIDFSSWITTAVGGFFSFEFIPGFSLGMILFFVIGLAAVAFFIRFFGG